MNYSPKSNELESKDAMKFMLSLELKQSEKDNTSQRVIKRIGDEFHTI